jgi:cell wall-associated NlpC family hydrolase
MQCRIPPWARVCVVAGVISGAQAVAATSVFADEVTRVTHTSSQEDFSDRSSTTSPVVPSSVQAALRDTDQEHPESGAHSVHPADIVTGALNLIGVRYRWGGNAPDSGLDCSGFVRYVFRDTLGLSLPRRAAEMSRVGEKVRLADLKPGDLVFFNTVRRAVSHVGIYIGDKKFVHSPSTGSTIRVDEMDNGYWEKRFTGARRIDEAMQVAASADHEGAVRLR